MNDRLNRKNNERVVGESKKKLVMVEYLMFTLVRQCPAQMKRHAGNDDACISRTIYYIQDMFNSIEGKLPGHVMGKRSWLDADSVRCQISVRLRQDKKSRNWALVKIDPQFRTNSKHPVYSAVSFYYYPERGGNKLI